MAYAKFNIHFNVCFYTFVGSRSPVDVEIVDGSASAWDTRKNWGRESTGEQPTRMVGSGVLGEQRTGGQRRVIRVVGVGGVDQSVGITGGQQ